MTGPERSFTADMPAAPKYTTTQMKTGTGSLYTVHQYLLEQGDVAYIVQAATYPEDINVSNPRTNLQGGLDNLAKSMEGAKWASVDWVTHQGLTATDAVGARSGHAIRSFSVMKGRQVFTLIYAGAPGNGPLGRCQPFRRLTARWRRRAGLLSSGSTRPGSRANFRHRAQSRGDRQSLRAIAREVALELRASVPS